MNNSALGVIVIGQTPRPALEAEIRLVLGSEVRIVVAGALDGVPRAEIDGFVPRGSHDTLFTWLSDGSEVIVSKAEVTKRAQRHLDRFAAEGIDVVLMSCTGVFHGLEPRGQVVWPSRTLTHLVKALLPEGRLGAFIPLDDQEEAIREKWSEMGYQEVAVVTLPPGQGAPELEPAARRMAELRPDLMVMDCMGYTQAMKERVRAITGIRTVLAISSACRAVQELME